MPNYNVQLQDSGCIRNPIVFSTLCLMVREAFQPSPRMRAVSRKMNGLSPIQPREPPPKLIFGLSPMRSQIQDAESRTTQYSSVPRLKIFTFLAGAFSNAVRTAATQSWTYRYDFRWLPSPRICNWSGCSRNWL